MKTKIFMVAILAITLVACNQSNKDHDSHEGHKHEEETHSHSHEGHNHEEEAHTDAHVGEEHEEVKFQYTAYSSNYEVFAEADAFIVGETANVLSHFSTIPDFKAVELGKMTIFLSVKGIETTQTLDKPTRKGIYSFDIKPETEGKGYLKFVLTNEKGTFEIVVPEISVFANDEAAHEASRKKIKPSMTNTTVFTKEQSWKVDFATSLPTNKPFGQVIKTTALVKSSQGNEQIIAAKTSGIVMLSENTLLEGKDVLSGQALFTIVGGTADNNISVKYAEAKSNFEKASSDYERATELAKDKIISAKDLQVAKNQFENTKAVYDNLKQSFNGSGQSVSSSMSGYIKQIFVKNGSFVEAGQPLISVSQNKTLQLTAEVPQRYVNALPFIKSANIRSMGENQTFSFEQLNGKVLSYGKSANPDNYLIPVNLQIDNKGNFINGSFVEVYLISSTGANTLSVPNTSLLEEQGSYFIWVQVTPELFEKREVHIGTTDGLNTEIKSGIAATERIVTRGAMLIKLAQATGSLDAHSGHVH
jgi:RND family efflux transporter MFP subunit